MAATGRTLSPGGALLRASRMFSLPSALPPPPSDLKSVSHYDSNTATQTYPTLQSVTVPDNFRQRGDWGFKRNFPMRSTARTSTPYLRIKQVDSIEHVTDFNSAADHSLTLEKFQEMNVAISLPGPNATDVGMSYTKHVAESVFEDKHDFTVLEAAKIKEAGQRRWKYKGPWLANLPEGMFQKYIKKEVRGRRLEFREFLKGKLASDLTREAEARAMDQGLDQEVPAIRSEDVTDEQITAFLRNSREHRMALFDHVSEFLDLAPCKPQNKTEDYVGNMSAGQTKELDADDPYSKIGPPITHPSAGLSYLRTNAFLENHPVYGPQAAHRPVKARVMSVRPGAQGIGVGGLVAETDAVRQIFRAGGEGQYDHQLPGGPKMWVNVTGAHVTSTGQAVVSVVAADQEATLIEQERQGEKRHYRSKTEESEQHRFAIRGRGSADDFGAPSSPRALNRAKQTYRNSDPVRYGFDPASRSPEGSEW